jgi:DNA polymerase III subunit gamma/tau
MSYQVIARKWRPQTFEEVTGQEPVTRTLRNAIEHERLHHAYLFSGARGVGKTTTARLLAKAVNCHKAEGPTPTPCSANDPTACPSCREIAEGRSIDVLEIDAASNTGVDNVRDAIINTVGVRPARDRYKVFIIDEVHMLSGAAFNALLKTLEEPPPRVLFIMATTEQHKLPDTILSRCQIFEFRTIAAAKIAERLRLIADAEGVKVSEEALREIARAGEGSMRDAQSAFDQVISFSEGEITPADVEAALGIAGAEMLARVVGAVAAERPSEMIAVVEDLVTRGHDLRNFCRDLLAHLRDLLVAKVAGDSAAFGDAGETGAAERRALLEQARDFSESDLVRFFHSLTETERQLRESVHPRYQLEIGLVKLVEMRRLAPLSKIVERLNALEAALRTGAAPAGGAGAPNAPASNSGGPTPRGGAAGSGGAALANDVSAATRRATADQSAPPPNGEDRAGADASAAHRRPASGAQSPPARDAQPERLVAGDAAGMTNGVIAPARDARAQTDSAPAASSVTPHAAFGAGRAAVSSHPNLKLVPPPSNGATAAATALADAPFALGDEAPPAQLFEPPRPAFAEVKAGEDRVGGPLALGATAEGRGEAGPPPFAADEEEPGGTAGLIRRKLEARNKPLLAMAVEGARRLRVEDEEVRVEFAPESKHLREMLNKPEALRLLREVCCEVVGRGVGVRTEVRAAGTGDEEPLTPEDEERLERRRLRERAENHPALRHVLKAFRAEIIEVRRADDSPPRVM